MTTGILFIISRNGHVDLSIVLTSEPKECSYFEHVIQLLSSLCLFGHGAIPNHKPRKN